MNVPFPFQYLCRKWNQGLQCELTQSNVYIVHLPFLVIPIFDFLFPTFPLCSIRSAPLAAHLATDRPPSLLLPPVLAAPHLSVNLLSAPLMEWATWKERMCPLTFVRHGTNVTQLVLV